MITREIIHHMPEVPGIFRRDQMRFAMADASDIGISTEAFAARTLSELDAEKLNQIVEVLGHPNLEVLIDEGKISFAMVRPQAHESVFNGTDDTAAIKLMDEIRSIGETEGFEIIFTASIAFTPSMVDTFYSGPPKKKMLEIPSERGKHVTRWDEFKDFMSSGPTTVLLLYAADGNTVKKWRGHVGHVRLEESKPGTFRARFARDNYNNLVHGSDNILAVQREVSFLRTYFTNVQRMLPSQPNSK